MWSHRSSFTTYVTTHPSPDLELSILELGKFLELWEQKPDFWPRESDSGAEIFSRNPVDNLYWTDALGNYICDHIAPGDHNSLVLKFAHCLGSSDGKWGVRLAIKDIAFGLELFSGNHPSHAIGFEV